MIYKKSEVVGMFTRLVKALNEQNNGWYLDYIACYGGYVIEQNLSEGGVSHPFGCMRRSAKEMYLSMYMAAQVAEKLNTRREV